jgi:hypothetical protein
MDLLYHHPIQQIAATLLLLFGLSSALWGLHLLFLGIRKPDHLSDPLRVVRGLWAVIVALALVVWSCAILFRKEWLFIVGGIVVAQELYEMGFLSLILRADKKCSVLTKRL